MQGFAGISIQGDRDAGQFYVPRAKAMLRKLIDRTRVGGIVVSSDFARLDDHAYCYVFVASGIQRAVIVVDAPPSKEPVTEDLVYPIVPDFVSGATTDPLITDATATKPAFLRRFWPTAACGQLFGIPTTPQPMRRLAVTPFDAFSSPEALGPPENYTGPTWSQYVKCKPTMYSGRMRGVVQLLLGFGKQAKKSIYDRTPPKVGTPAQRRRKREQPTQYETDVAKNGLQIRYDWRWYRTHGIGVGADGKLWIVEIGNTRGAIAMPLPMHDITSLPAFREKLERMGDSAGLAALAEFKGFPTGESFPTGDIEPWIRAGRVIRLGPKEVMDDFYEHQTYSSAMGWAFNQSGNEAHNTAWDTRPDLRKEGFHYGFSFSIGPFQEVEEAPNAGRLRARIADKSGDANFDANVWKTYRMSEFDIRALFSFNTDVDSLYAALDAFVAPPVATGSGNLWLESRGNLTKEGAKAQYELKFPWPELGYLASFDMRLIGSQVPLKCNTDVHVFYIGDRLRIVRFFNDPRKIPAPSVDDDSDGCELVGTFTRKTSSGSLGMPPMVYSLDFDDRRELVGGRSIRVIVGRDLGYFRASVADDLTFPPHGHLTRAKRFQRQVTTETWSGESMVSAMVVPFYDRCAYYYALGESYESYSKTVIYGYVERGDPWSCDTWRNFPGFTGHSTANGYIRAEHPDGCGPVDARTVRAPGAVYDPSECSDFADSGAWCNVCDNADSMTYVIPEPPTPAGTVDFRPRTATRRAWLINENGETPIQTESVTFTGDWTGFMAPWFLPSPDPDSLITQFAQVTHNALGSGTAMQYYDKPNGSIQVLGGPQPPDFKTANTTFVGVVP